MHVLFAKPITELSLFIEQHRDALQQHSGIYGLNNQFIFTPPLGRLFGSLAEACAYFEEDISFQTAWYSTFTVRIIYGQAWKHEQDPEEKDHLAQDLFELQEMCKHFEFLHFMIIHLQKQEALCNKPAF